MKKYMFLFLGLILLSGSFLVYRISVKKSISIETAVKSGVISAEILGLGGHTGNCIEAKIKNLSPKDTIVLIESGRRFDSSDSTVQDILNVKEDSVFLFAGEEKVISIFGFCCQATNRSPAAKSIFTPGKMANDSLVLIARFLQTCKLPLSTMQSAVWVFSNHHQIESITAEGDIYKDELKRLHTYVANLKHIPIPWYTIVYKKDTVQLFSNRPVYLSGTFEFEVWNNGIASLVLYSDNHIVIKRFFSKPYNPGKYSFPFELNVANYPKGKYFMRLYSENQLKVERVINL